jgi:hypothetical protein
MPLRSYAWTVGGLNQDPKGIDVKYHVMEGALKAADVIKLSEAKTLKVSLSCGGEGSKTRVNDATDRPDLETHMIQTIDGLVRPKLKKSPSSLCP